MTSPPRAGAGPAGIGARSAWFLTPLLDTPDVPHHVVNARNGAVIADSVTPAFDSRSRRQGLLGREGLAAGEALLIAPCQSIHTWFMRFAIDVAFVAGDGRVVSLRVRMPPWRMAISWRAYSVVELAPGALEASETRAGDVLTIV